MFELFKKKRHRNAQHGAFFFNIILSEIKWHTKFVIKRKLKLRLIVQVYIIVKIELFGE